MLCIIIRRISGQLLLCNVMCHITVLLWSHGRDMILVPVHVMYNDFHGLSCAHSYTSCYTLTYVYAAIHNISGIMHIWIPLHTKPEHHYWWNSSKAPWMSRKLYSQWLWLHSQHINKGFLNYTFIEINKNSITCTKLSWIIHNLLN